MSLLNGSYIGFHVYKMGIIITPALWDDYEN